MLTHHVLGHEGHLTSELEACGQNVCTPLPAVVNLILLTKVHSQLWLPTFLTILGEHRSQTLTEIQEKMTFPTVTRNSSLARIQRILS